MSLFVSCNSFGREKIKILILPKFEIDNLTGDYPGEAQYYFEKYFIDAKKYQVTDGSQGILYVKNNLALCITGMGKTNAALTLTSLLSDKRFDWSETYIISTGCAGGAKDVCVLGDVVIGTASCDIDLGHTADPREMTSKNKDTTWFNDAQYDVSAFVLFDKNLSEKIYSLTKDVTLEVNNSAKKAMAKNFDDAPWAVRDPKVVKGTICTGDNYWKGIYSHNNAVKISKHYGAPDSFAATEMEDNVLAYVAKRFNKLNKFIAIRDVVDMDVFSGGETPEKMWNHEGENTESDENGEDVFLTGRKNNFIVGEKIIEGLLKEFN